MSTYIITADLLNAWIEYIQADEEKQKYREADLINILNRTVFTRNVTPENIKAHLDGTSKSKEKTIIQLAETVAGGTWGTQGVVRGEVAGLKYILRHRCDVIKGPVAYKLLRVQRYGIGDYFHAADHRIAFACFQGIQEFQYLISTGRDVCQEFYTRKGTQDIKELILDFRLWLSVYPKYEKMYFDNWAATSGRDNQAKQDVF